jgi:hypothetical protein
MSWRWRAHCLGSMHTANGYMYPYRVFDWRTPCCSGKLHAWFPALWRPPLIASITQDAPAYTDVLWQMQRDAAISLTLAAGAIGALAIAGRAAAARL